MRRLGWWIKRLFILGVVVAASVGAFCWYQLQGIYAHQAADHTQDWIHIPYPKVTAQPGQDLKQIKRGEYLARAGNCISCHSRQGGKPFAGGAPIKSPFGTFYGPNITSSKRYGIGQWSDKDFIRAMREGIRPDGSFYYPAIPYLYFNHLSDEDILAIKAYLMATPAVEKPSTPNELPFPLNIRFLQLGWRILFFYPYADGPIHQDPQKDAVWNRGHYLVEGLGHCQMCHTPINLLGGPKRSERFTGAIVESYYAPNISGNGTLKGLSLSELEHFFRHSVLPGDHAIQAPGMRQVNANSLSYLSQDDLQAIGTYLKSIKTKVPEVKAGSGKGKQIYEQYCAGCHNNGAAGAPKIGDSKAWQDRLNTGGRDMIVKMAIKGINGMPAKGLCQTCTDEDIGTTVDYILSQTPLGGNVSVLLGEAPAKPTLKRGKEVYEKVCSLCHDKGALGSPKLSDTAAWRKLSRKGMDVLTLHTLQGYGLMPQNGGCTDCDTTDIMAAVKYILQTTHSRNDYRLW